MDFRTDSPTEIAKAVGIHVSQVIRWFGGSHVSESTLDKIAEAYLLDSPMVLQILKARRAQYAKASQA